MKRLLIIALFGLFVLNANSQVRWPFGAANEITVTVNDTIEVGTNLSRGINYIDMSTDTNIVLNATTIDTEVKIGDLLILEATEAGVDADTINYGTNITGLYDAIPSDKTRIITFIYNGSKFVKVSTTQID